MASPETSRTPSPSSTSSPFLLCALLVGSLSIPVAHAATPDRCRSDHACLEKTEQAAQLAGQTRYDEALALYLEAYESFHEPRLLVNIGRCHYRLGRARKALDFYEQFQKAEPDPETELAARVGQFIAEAKLAILSDGGQPKPKPEEVAQGTSHPPTPELNVPTSAPLVEPPPVASPADVGPGKTLFGRPLWRVALGGSALGGGALFIGIGAGALSANGSCVMDSTMTGRCEPMLRADGERVTTVLDGITPGVPLLLVGIALAAGGVALVAVPPRRPQVAK